MSEPLKKSSGGREIGRAAFLAGVIWTAVLAGSLVLGFRQQRLFLQKLAESEAETIADMDISFRNWIVGQEAVYIAAAKTAAPDTFLRAPDKAIKTPSGLGLMRVSHAYIMRQLSDMRAREGLPRSGLRDLHARDRNEAPSEWERSALSGFARGEREVFSLTNSVSVKYLRAFRAEAACLACHTPAEARGGLHSGISVEVPLTPFKKLGARMLAHWILGHSLIWFAGLLVIIYSYTRLAREQSRCETLLSALKETLAQVKYLSGTIPICASCKKIRNDKGDWETVERYVAGHSDAKFSHGVCPDCGKRIYGKFYQETPPAEE